MSQLLAAIEGPAFIPLPGIGRVHTTFRDGAYTSPPRFVGDAAHEFGFKRRDEILGAIRNGNTTRSLISKATGIPSGSLGNHFKKLLASGSVYVTKDGVPGHIETEYGAVEATNAET